MNRKARRQEKAVTRRRKAINGVWLDVSTASLLYGPSERSFWGMVARGVIPYRKMQSRVVFSRQILDEWFEALPGVSMDEAKANAAARQKGGV